MAANCCIEFINYGGNDALLVAFEHFRQVFAGFGLFHLLAAVIESFVYLIVKIHPVGNQYNLVIRNIFAERDGLGQKDHSQGLPAALSVPDHATLAASFPVSYTDTLHDFFYAKILLIACNFFVASIEQDKTMCQFQESFRPTESI